MLTVTRVDNGNTVTGPTALILEFANELAKNGVDFTISK